MNTKRYIEAMESEHAGDWEKAHRIVQEINTPEAAWIHAFLHRIEGDPGNAAYWYRRAGRPVCDAPLDEERQTILDALRNA